MKISIFDIDLSRPAASATSLDAISMQIKRSQQQGFSGYWLPQATGMDALTALAAIGSGVDIPMGVAVVPIYNRHPAALAQQALTVNKALNGKLTLGVGASHRVFVERVWGYNFDRPVNYMAEYLEILLLLLEERQAYMKGKRLVMRGELDIEGPACAVMVAALGPRMLELAGKTTAGTITWMAGQKTIRDFVVPTINDAAEAAGRSSPQVIVGLPVCVTDSIIAAKKRATALLSKEEQASSYKQMLEREGLSSAGEICIIGNEDHVAQRLDEFFTAGASSILAAPTGTPEEVERTYNALAALVT
ncbi:MAG: TIGR03564 family F420-dependent LLM class oxidoreductase [Acidimicrobiia bacterium]|nr:TIGR03564 family F420-dependent LLM class oxidoreductase [Acidimicrobiia bacterium]MYC58230.1 TIGR03564 family F420-dependent LLM class oxidoreductase [Acidimicrobiia bacterium]MYG93626.1 TIGR03564 family F420-dependent LLM class oxidoreductase [Acidimicrobiia bacterium]MYI30299.1 TIGR03564 family F420-dependent LLM class oxidoreductase [Acidimicrobiia bacterium]